MDIALFFSAFIAGLLTFLAPCTLPLIPGYIAFISGASMKDFHDTQKLTRAGRKALLNGVFFVIGFSVVFVFFGSIAGLIGSALGEYRLILSRVGGVIVILFGLVMMKAIRISVLEKSWHTKLPAFVRPGHPSSAFLIGSTFAFGWTPCVGPILGSILLIASTSSTALQGFFLLLTFSLGLAIPFLFVAGSVGASVRYVRNMGKYLRLISVIGGAFFVLIGLFLLMNSFSLINQYGYELFDFVNYDSLMQYL